MILTYHTTRVHAAEKGTPGMNPTDLLQQNLETFLIAPSYPALKRLVETTPYSRQLANIVFRLTVKTTEAEVRGLGRLCRGLNPRAREAQFILSHLPGIQQSCQHLDWLYDQYPKSTEALQDFLTIYRSVLDALLQQLNALVETATQKGLTTNPTFQSFRKYHKKLPQSPNTVYLTTLDRDRLRQLAREGPEQ
jgi:hypothetical protein